MSPVTSSDLPLISAIMPTRNRPGFARAAVDCFLSQTWPNKELVIVDDDERPSFLGGISDPGVRYFAEYRRLSIGAKRNLACSRANGNIICHFDDDDWSHPRRIEDQVVRLLESGAPITGYHAMVFVDAANRKAWKYTGHQGYGIGTSLMYRRELWEKKPFVDFPTRADGSPSFGEDNAFIAPYLRVLKSADAEELMFATVHAGNTSKRDLSTADFKSIQWPGWIKQ